MVPSQVAELRFSRALTLGQARWLRGAVCGSATSGRAATLSNINADFHKNLIPVKWKETSTGDERLVKIGHSEYAAIRFPVVGKLLISLVFCVGRILNGRNYSD